MKNKYFMKNCLYAVLLSCFAVINTTAQTISEYKQYDFVPGNVILFDDDLTNSIVGSNPDNWNIEGGEAKVIKEADNNCISVNVYYTKISPKLSKPVLPDNFTIEYDTWLADGYDGNPGIEIHLMQGDQEMIITPNKHELTVSYPNDGRAAKDNPEAYFGENKFYNRWVHIAMSYNKKHFTVYLDQYKQIDIDDCAITPDRIFVTGNTSGEMKILLDNFKVATGIPKSEITLVNGKFVTHAIKFDVNKSEIKPESMGTINNIVAYLKQNPTVKFEIGGHTDSDGDDAANLKLSEARANAVLNLLISLGVNSNQLTAKGYGESLPIDVNTTQLGKANNRRVEFTTI